MLEIDPKRVPLLSGLSRLAWARLLPEVSMREMQCGQEIPSAGDAVDIIYDGQVDWVCLHGGEPLSLVALCPGDVILRSGELGEGLYRCATQVRLLTIKRAKFDAIIKAHPDVSRALQNQLSSRLQLTQYELVKSRRLLFQYAKELWGHVPELEVAAALAVEPPAPAVPERAKEAEPRVTRRQAVTPWWRSRWFGPVVGMLLGLAFLAVVPSGAHPSIYLIAVFLWAGFNWALATIPDHVVALTAALACVALGLATLEGAFGGFASASWWLLVAVLGLVAVVAKTGVLYRMALAMLQWLPQTYSGQMLALTLTGLFMTPCLPNTNVRVSILGPLSAELSDAVGFEPKSKGAIGLAMAAYLGASQSYFLFLNGATMGMLMWGILPPEVKDQVTWSFWLVAAMPMAAVLIVGFLTILHLFFRPTSVKPVARSTIEMQRKVLGPLGRQEWLAVVTLGAVLMAFVTEPLHGISATWIVMGVFLFAMGSGLLDRESLKTIDWSLIFYMGSVISLSAVASRLGMNQLLAGLIAPWVSSLAISPVLLLVGVAALTVLLRLAVPPPVVTVVLTVALSPVAQSLGISPFLVGLVIVAFCSSWLVPQQWSVYLNLHTVTGERFTHKQVHPLAWANNALLLVGLLVSVPLWQWLGLMP